VDAGDGTMSRVTIHFDVPDGDESMAAMAVEDALPDTAENFEWDAEE
jgi:hypothetical protein